MADKGGYIGRSPGDSAVIIARQNYSPTGVQTDFTFNSGYTPGYVDVYINGVRLIDVQDYTASTGNTVGLTSYANNGDIVEVIAYKAFNVGNVSDATSNFNVGGNLTVSGDTNVSGSSTFVDVNISGATTASGASYLTGASYLSNVTEFVSSGIVTVSNTTDSTSTTTGALQVRGGVGVALSMTVGGNLSVGGTVTYEDVTNVDAIGIITARSDVSIADKIIHTGDTNTAIRFPSADTFSVETGGSEALRVDSEQKILIGATSELFSQNDKLQIADTSANAGIIVQRAGDNANPPYFNFHKTRSASVGGATIVQSGDELGRIRWNGTNGSGINYAAEIRGYVDGTPGASNDMPGRIAFYTTPDGSGTPAERLRIASDGDVIIGGSSDAGYADYADNLTIHDAQNSGITIRSGIASQGAIYFSDDTGTAAGTYVGNIIYDHSDNHMRFATNGGEKLRIDSTGIIEMRSNMQTLGNQNIIRFTDTDTSVSAGQTIGRLQWYSSDASGGGACVKAEIEAVCTDTTPDAFLAFKTHDGSGTTPETRLKITSAGRLLLGTTVDSVFNGGRNASFQQEGTNSATSALAITRNSDDANPAYLSLGKSRGTSVGANTAVQNGDDIGTIEFNAGDGSGSFNAHALIKGSVGAAPGNSDAPGRLSFWTTPDGGSTTPAERLRIHPSGLIETKTRTAEVRRIILSGSPSNASFNIEAHDGETGTSAGDVQGKLGLFYNDGSTLNNTACLSFERGSSSADGAMSIVTNSAERMRISSDGRVGVGTASMSCALHVYHATNNEQGRFESGDAYSHIVIKDSGSNHSSPPYFGVQSNDFRFVTYGNGSSAERFRIKDDGQIQIKTGISTLSGSGTLRVNSGSTTGLLTLDGGASNHGGEIGLYGGSNGGRILFRCGQGTGQQSEKMRLNENGKLGINQTSPDTLLHIAGDETAVIRLENPNAMGQDAVVGKLEFEKQDASGAGAGICGAVKCLSDDSYGARTYLAFTVRSNSTGAAAVDTEICRMTPRGLQFMGDTASENALSDYEEGTFTPAYKAVSANPTVGYQNQDGKYTKIGNVVFYQMYLRINSWSGGSGAIYIDGFPYTSSSSTYGGGPGILYVNSWGGDRPTNSMLSSSTATLYLYNGINSGTSENQYSADIGTTSQLRINGSYLTDT